MPVAVMIGAPPLELTYLGNYYDASNTGSFSFPGVSFGSAATDRLIIGLISYRRNSALGISGVTIGGISATVVAGTATSTDDTYIFYAPVPSGTSGTIAMTMNSAGASMSVYSLTGQYSNSPVFTNYQTSGTPVSVTTTFNDRSAILATAVAGPAASGFAGSLLMTTDLVRNPAASTGDMLHRTASLVTTSNLGSQSIQHGASGATKMAVAIWQ